MQTTVQLSAKMAKTIMARWWLFDKKIKIHYSQLSHKILEYFMREPHISYVCPRYYIFERCVNTKLNKIELKINLYAILIIITQITRSNLGKKDI